MLNSVFIKTYVFIYKIYVFVCVCVLLEFDMPNLITNELLGIYANN